MSTFLVIGGLGIVLLLVALLVGDHVDGALGAFGGGEWFTGAALAGFLGALGFIGALTLGLTGSVLIASVIGTMSGLTLGAGVGWVTVRLRDTGKNDVVRTSALVGRDGTVISDIPLDGYGEIAIVYTGQPMKLNARAAGPISTGTPVTVTDVLSPTSVHVRPTYR
ncbi:MAG: hypothetical protein WAS07_12685 [Micropruina sp.]|nr:hypothetical protein [Micropruina sp.]